MSSNQFTVAYLKEIVFTDLSLEEQLEIKRIGRPTPVINLVQVSKSKSREFKREFKSGIYAKNIWICGCEESNKLFCFPCLLLAKQDGDPCWTKQGVSDLSHLSLKTKRHECIQSHLSSMLELNLLGKPGIRQLFNSEYRQSVKQQKERSLVNRAELSKIVVDCVNSCRSAFESSSLSSSARDTNAMGRGVFKTRIKLSNESDTYLKDHLSISKIFEGVPTRTRNDLLDCMLSVCQEHIKKEIRSASFVSVIIDETYDSSNEYRYAIFFRYLLTDGEPVERFWDFINPPEHDATSIARCISDALDKVVSVPYKVVSQSFDGVSMCEHRSSIQAVMQYKYKYAHMIHCYAHRLDIVVTQAMSQIPELRTFFEDVSLILNFFTDSPLKIAVMNEIVGRKFHRIKDLEPTWNFILNTVFVYRIHLIESVEALESASKNSYDDRLKLENIRTLLLDCDFIFWLSVTRNIMPHVDILANKLLIGNINTLVIRKNVEVFVKSIEKERDDMNYIEDQFEKSAIESELLSKRIKIDYNNPEKTNKASEVFNIVINEIKARFSFKKHYCAATLFDPQKFHQFDSHFPNQSLEEVTDTYTFLEKDHLKTELAIIYKRPDFLSMGGIVSLLQFIHENDLEPIFTESYKLLMIITSVPMITWESDRCFDTLRNLRTFARSISSADLSSPLVMITLENNLIKNIPNFENYVINLYASTKNV